MGYLANYSHNYLYRCDLCRFVSDNKKDYRRHTLSKKHANRVKATPHHVVMPTSEPITPHHTNVNSASLPTTCIPSVSTVNHAFMFDERIYKYCDKCNQKYYSKSGLWKHRKTCQGVVSPTLASVPAPVVPPPPSVGITTDQELKAMMMDLLKNNQEFQHKIIEMICNQQQSIASSAAAVCAAAAPPSNYTNSNNYTTATNSHNTNNNTFNLQFFLNEKCKDAMNITDFASSIHLKVSDLDDFGRLGYVEGMSKLFIDSLRETDVCKRPIHCSDAKRETLYVKDDDKWQREDPQNTKITNAVRVVEHKNIVLVNEWAKQNPRCENSSTKENAQYINMSRAVLDGDEKNIAKVIKLVAKEVIIDK